MPPKRLAPLPDRNRSGPGVVTARGVGATVLAGQFAGYVAESRGGVGVDHVQELVGFLGDARASIAAMCAAWVSL